MKSYFYNNPKQGNTATTVNGLKCLLLKNLNKKKYSFN